jgi:acetyl-CoA C-acetyltransferase
MFGLGPIPAVKQALERAGWDIGSVERVEINEAFAAIAIVVARELGLQEEIVNVEGGAVAHGHPIGATGAVLITRLIHSMRPSEPRPRYPVHRGRPGHRASDRVDAVRTPSVA